MFSIGQHVIHPGQGVCTVVGFRDDTPQPMLLLETKQGHAQTILMYPVAQADRLHAAISQQDAEHLLSHYDELECDTFTERNSSLEETHFKQQLKLGAPETVPAGKHAASTSTATRPSTSPETAETMCMTCEKRSTSA